MSDTRRTTPWLTDLTPSEQQRLEDVHRIKCHNCRMKAVRELERDVRNRQEGPGGASTPDQPTGDER